VEAGCGRCGADATDWGGGLTSDRPQMGGCVLELSEMVEETGRRRRAWLRDVGSARVVRQPPTEEASETRA
jgi:hypothetical protein